MNTKYIKSLLLVFAVLLTALGFGLSYGTGNHNTYLIHGLSLIDPDWLVNDWFTRSTRHYHDHFSGLLLFLDALGLPLDWSLAVLSVLLRMVALAALYQITSLVLKKKAWLAFLLLLVFIVFEQTKSVADSYLFYPILQPSTFGSVFTVLGLLFFLQKRYFISGLAIAVAGFMHTNFLLLGFVYFGSAHLLLGLRLFIQRCLKQFTPMLLIFAIKLPFLLSMLGAEDGAMATYIFQFVRSPHHYVPSYFIFDFVLFAGWSVLGFAGLRLLNMDKHLKARFIALYTALFVTIVMATLLTSIVFIPFISKLFFWRLAPFSVVLSQLLFAAAIIKQADEKSWKATKGELPSLVMLFLGLLLVMRWYLFRYGMMSLEFWVMALILYFCVVLAARHLWEKVISNKLLSDKLPALICMTLFVCVTLFQFTERFFANSNLITGYPAEAESELYQWAKMTDPTARFVIPPSLSDFRLHAGRSIVADWKSTPIDAAGLMEWQQRIKDITGLDDLGSEHKVNHAYLHITPSQLIYLKHKYQVNYAVVHAQPDTLIKVFPIAFSNADYTVFSLQP